MVFKIEGKSLYGKRIRFSIFYLEFLKKICIYPVITIYKSNPFSLSLFNTEVSR